MKYGLVCMLHKQGFKKGFVGLKSINKANQQEINKKLYDATVFNLKQTYNNIQYCIDNNIDGYRISSEVIPFYEYWNWKSNRYILDLINKCNKLASSNSVEINIHPDQFCVINSQDSNVVSKSITILLHHYELAKLFNIKNIILHIGGVYNDKDNAMQRFIDNYMLLPLGIQKLLALENCHYFSPYDVKMISELCGIKTVYDLHHARIVDNNITTQQHINNLSVLNPSLVHISSGKKSKFDKSHADYISDEDKIQFNEILKNYKGIIEVEAKYKQLSIKEVI